MEYTQGKPNKNGKATQAQGKLLTWRKNAQAAVPCYWSAIDATAIRGAIDAVSRAGGAIMFGVTSDGGAYSVMVLYKDQKIKEYPHGDAECEDLLREITQTFAEESL